MSTEARTYTQPLWTVQRQHPDRLLYSAKANVWSTRHQSVLEVALKKREVPSPNLLLLEVNGAGVLRNGCKALPFSDGKICAGPVVGVLAMAFDHTHSPSVASNLSTAQGQSRRIQCLAPVCVGLVRTNATTDLEPHPFESPNGLLDLYGSPRSTSWRVATSMRE